MKQLILLVMACIITPLSAMASEPEDYHVKGILADGTIIEGYNNTSFNNEFKPLVTEVSISEEYGGEPKKYTSDELKTLWFTKTENDSVPVVFQAVMAPKKLPNYFSKNPKPHKKPVFLRLVYNGKNVKGYARPVTDYTRVPSMTRVVHTWMYYYLTKDSDVAVAYWVETNDLVPAMRKVMKFYMREFPAIVKMIDDKELTPDMYRSNPACVLPLIDATYGQ